MKDILKLFIFILIYTKITSPLLIDNKSANLDNNNKTYVVQKDDNLWKIAEKYDRNNKEEFIFLLNEALKIKVKSEKNFQLTNTISKNRAEWLLNNIDEFFY